MLSNQQDSNITGKCKFYALRSWGVAKRLFVAKPRFCNRPFVASWPCCHYNRNPLFIANHDILSSAPPSRDEAKPAAGVVPRRPQCDASKTKGLTRDLYCPAFAPCLHASKRKLYIEKPVIGIASPRIKLS
eukprot:3841213-Pyramimonas_sp.AAC.1